MDAVRQFDVSGRAGGHPSVVGAHDRTLINEASEDLLEEERVSLRATQDLRAQALGEVVDVEKRVDQRDALALGQRAEGERRCAGRGSEPWVLLRELGPCGRNDKDAPGCPRADLLDHVEQLIIGPMEVLDHEHGRRRASDGGDEPRPRARHDARKLAGFQVGQGDLRKGDVRRRGECGDRLAQLRSLHPQRFQQLRQRSAKLVA